MALTRVIMRGDYYVVPPNSARHVGAPARLYSIAGLGGPDTLIPARAILVGNFKTRIGRAKENYLLAIPLLRTENFHVVDLAQPSKDVCLHLKEYSLYRMFQIQDLLQLSILGK